MSQSDSSNVALIVGGGESVWSDLQAATALCASAGRTIAAFAINDLIPRYAGECRAVTLHPEKIAVWLKERERAGFPKPLEVWSHSSSRNRAGIDRVTNDWRGSSGLLATKIAIELGHKAIILCGVPMSGKHVVRGKIWSSASVFKPSWLTHKRLLLPYVRSYSGWTGDLFGPPTSEFLDSNHCTT